MFLISMNCKEILISMFNLISVLIELQQTGFGMLESGCVSVKNEVNIMMKNIVDIVLGGCKNEMLCN